MRLLSNSRPIRTTRKYTARICGPCVRPVHTGVFLTPVHNGPYLRPVFTGSAYRSPVCTARIYGPYKTAILYGYILQVLRSDLELTMIASRRWYLYTKATNVCGIQDLLITKRVSSDVVFANIYSGIFRVTYTGELFDTHTRAVSTVVENAPVRTGRMYGQYVLPVHTARTYWPYVRVVHIGLQTNFMYIIH